MFHLRKLVAIALLSTSLTAVGESFTLSSQDISEDAFMPKAQEYGGFGCSGEDMSPQLQWANVPEGTKSFAITAYDPDAPTGSGWWHWQLVNIPGDVTELVAGAGGSDSGLTPAGSMHIGNDYGSKAFGGACPPEGHGVHHYRFTVHALSVESLALPENASGALAGYMINANTIASSTIVALYKRD